MTKPSPPLRPTEEDARPLMRGLASLPVFWDVKGKRVVLAGGSAAALWKAELLCAAGASLDVYSAAPCAELSAFVARLPAARLILRDFAPEDLKGAALAVADAEGSDAAAAFKAAAEAAGVPANIIDKQEFSDFQFGAIVDRSPLIVAVSTGGGAPALAQALRGRLEATLADEIRLWAGAAKAWRRKLKTLDPSAKVRRRFWELFSAKALDARRNGPVEADFAVLLAQSKTEVETGAPAAMMGSVALVGAGPGDPELLTLKALRLLQSADVVLYDDLVAPGVVEMARREAAKIPVGKRGYRPSCRQEHIVSLMISLAKSGKRVVRLKGGDPMIFGRANEEIAALREARVPFEATPGVTAALGAAAALRVSLTERTKARRVQFITAHAHDGKLPDDMDWRALCDSRASSVVYMGRKTLGALADRLLAEGLDPATPAMLVERATWPNQRVIAGTIADLPAKIDAGAFPGPCVILIGEVFAASEEEQEQKQEAARATGERLKTILKELT